MSWLWIRPLGGSRSCGYLRRVPTFSHRWLLTAVLAIAAALESAPAPALSPGEIFSPRAANVIPIPLIGIDPDSGTTLGVIGAWLRHDADGSVNRIIAPDVLYNSYFGWGLRGRILDYPSEDTAWSLIAGAKQRVEHKLDAQYQTGIRRQSAWSFSASATDERSGTQRFFGFGNDTALARESAYTTEHVLLQAFIGHNFSPRWQLAYLLRFRNEDVTAGVLPDLPSITTLYPALAGLGSNHELLSRLMLIYDSRDDVVLPTRGVQAVLYAGLSSRGGFLNDSLYSETGFDARGYVPFDGRTVLAMHVALRELPSFHRLPFWAESSLGGDGSSIGGPQPLRGFGQGRFTDVDLFSTSVELRRIVTSLHVFATRIDLELAPFLEVGRVFSRLSASPLAGLHRIGGLGVRGIARPFIVAYVDVGYGSEGSAAFSGINYIF